MIQTSVIEHRMRPVCLRLPEHGRLGSDGMAGLLTCEPSPTPQPLEGVQPVDPAAVLEQRCSEMLQDNAASEAPEWRTSANADLVERYLQGKQKVLRNAVAAMR